MGLIDLVALAVVQGAAEALPISATGHGVVARLWLDADRTAGWMDGPLYLAAAAALAFAIRRQLGDAIGAGVRAIARPGLFTTSPAAWDAALLSAGSALSLLVSETLRPFAEAWSRTPATVGVGLLVTGAALASTALLPRPAPDPPGASPARLEAPSLTGVATAGLAHGLATVPGVSRLGAALVLLLWFGVGPRRAVELSMALSVPALLAAGVHGVLAPSGPGPEPGLLAAVALIAFLSATIGAAALRRLSERGHTGALALWLIPLGLATLAYARALPGFT